MDVKASIWASWQRDSTILSAESANRGTGVSAWDGWVTNVTSHSDVTVDYGYRLLICYIAIEAMAHRNS